MVLCIVFEIQVWDLTFGLQLGNYRSDTPSWRSPQSHKYVASIFVVHLSSKCSLVTKKNGEIVNRSHPLSHTHTTTSSYLLFILLVSDGNQQNVWCISVSAIGKVLMCNSAFPLGSPHHLKCLVPIVTECIVLSIIPLNCSIVHCQGNQHYL